MNINYIKQSPAYSPAYIVLDKESGDFQEVDATIGRALIADLDTVTVCIEGSKTLSVESDYKVTLDLEDVREIADHDGQKVTFAEQVFVKQHMQYLHKESLAAIIGGASNREKVIVILAGF